MAFDVNDLIRDSLEFDIANTAVVDVANIEFSEEFRKLCEKNTCRQYGTNWMCPPGVGPLEELKNRVLSYRQGVLLQTVHSLRNSFDYRGMMAASAEHTKRMRQLIDHIETQYDDLEFLPLNVGPCSFCSKCAYPEDKECYFPHKAIASVEAYGINVMSLTKKHGIPYSNGKNTVSYVSLILVND